ncbi:hypothetical protein LTR04_000214 [Oleoguttula sp. CCFEE 6159]|nr:hypothetical protein LTR04_000214 [Oleoguttula sp. CCFEE 6159]
MQNLSRLLDSDSDNGDEAQRRQNSPAKKIQPVASKTPQTTSRSIKLKDRLRQTAVQGPVVADTSTSAKAKSKSATLGKSPSKQTPLMSKDTAVKGSVKTKVKPASSSTARSKTDVSSERLQGLNTSTTTVEEKAVDAEDLEGEDISMYDVPTSPHVNGAAKKKPSAAKKTPSSKLSGKLSISATKARNGLSAPTKRDAQSNDIWDPLEDSDSLKAPTTRKKPARPAGKGTAKKTTMRKSATKKSTAKVTKNTLSSRSDKSPFKITSGPSKKAGRSAERASEADHEVSQILSDIKLPPQRTTRASAAAIANDVKSPTADKEESQEQPLNDGFEEFVDYSHDDDDASIEVARKQLGKTAAAASVQDVGDVENPKSDATNEASQSALKRSEKSLEENTNEDIVSGSGTRQTMKPRIQERVAQKQPQNFIEEVQDRLMDVSKALVKGMEGASQDQAILISEGEESTSIASDSENEGQATGNAGPAVPSDEPQTPRSSPPVQANTVVSPIVDEEMMRKAQIISFSRQGPRNQGSVSTKKAPTASPLTTKRTATAAEPAAAEQSNQEPEIPTDNAPTPDPFALTAPSEELRERDNEKKRKAESMPAAMPQTKRSQRLHISPHTDEDVLIGENEGGEPELVVFSQNKISRRTSQRSIVTEYGSPIPVIDMVAENPAGAQSVQQNLQQRRAMDIDPAATYDEHSDDLNLLESHEYQHEKVPTQLLSSYSKPVPHPPEAESKAISGHVAARFLERAVADATAKDTDKENNPFAADPIKQQPKKITAFTHMLQSQVQARSIAREKSVEVPIDDPTSTTSDPDKTLVEQDEDVEMASPSSDSESSAPSTALAASPSDEMEWEASLNPQQRNIIDVLARISHRLVRHLIDEETAVADIATDYERDGTQLIENMQRAHRQEYDAWTAEFESRKKSLAGEFAAPEMRLRRGREDIARSGIREAGGAEKKRLEELAGRLGGMMEGYR